MKVSYTPAEFAACFKKEKTWTYRQLYAGKIEGIYDFGHLRIAASQLEKITSSSRQHKGKRAKANDPAEETGASPVIRASMRMLWSSWVRHSGVNRLKGMRGYRRTVQKWLGG